MLRPGDISTLAPSRDNFHTFEAGPSGAVWIDITTAHGKEGAGDFSYLRLSPPTTEPAWAMCSRRAGA